MALKQNPRPRPSPLQKPQKKVNCGNNPSKTPIYKNLISNKNAQTFY
jgi:hypothetical protein